MAKCEMCGKGPSFGNNVSFSKRHTRRSWKPNVQTMSLAVNGTKLQIRVCTRCQRTMSKAR